MVHGITKGRNNYERQETPSTKEALKWCAMFNKLYLLRSKLTWLLVVPGLHFYTIYANNLEAKVFTTLTYGWLQISQFEDDCIKQYSFISEVKVIVCFYHSYYSYVSSTNPSRVKFISLKIKYKIIPSYYDDSESDISLDKITPVKYTKYWLEKFALIRASTKI